MFMARAKLGPLLADADDWALARFQAALEGFPESADLHNELGFTHRKPRPFDNSERPHVEPPLHDARRTTHDARRTPQVLAPRDASGATPAPTAPANPRAFAARSPPSPM